MATIKKCPILVYCESFANYVGIEEYCKNCRYCKGRIDDNIMCTYGE